MIVIGPLHELTEGDSLTSDALPLPGAPNELVQSMAPRVPPDMDEPSNIAVRVRILEQHHIGEPLVTAPHGHPLVVAGRVATWIQDIYFCGAFPYQHA